MLYRSGVDLDTFFVRLRLRQFESADAFWDTMNQPENHVLREGVRRLIGRRIQGEYSAGDIDDLVTSRDAVNLLHHAFSPHIRVFLERWQELNLPAGDVLEIGCGAGVAACFMALQRPNSQIVGIDNSEAAITVARQLAEELQLVNISFVYTNLESLNLRKFFPVVFSTAVWAELSHGHDFDRKYFAGVTQIPRVLANSESALAAVSRRHLAKNGVYISFERCRSIVELAEWIGAQQAAGLRVDLTQSAMVPFVGVLTGGEAMPLLIARTTGQEISRGGIVRWRQTASVKSPELEVEIRVFLGDPWVVVEGVEIHIRDDFGDAAAQVFLLERTILGQDESLIFFTTNRGGREVLGESPQRSNSAFKKLFDDIVYQITSAGGVIAVFPVGELC